MEVLQSSSGGEFPIRLIHIVEDVGLELVASNQISICFGIRLASKEAFAPAARWRGSEGNVVNHDPNGSFCGYRNCSSASCSAGAGSRILDDLNAVKIKSRQDYQHMKHQGCHHHSPHCRCDRRSFCGGARMIYFTHCSDGGDLSICCESGIISSFSLLETDISSYFCCLYRSKRTNNER